MRDETGRNRVFGKSRGRAPRQKGDGCSLGYGDDERYSQEPDTTFDDQTDKLLG